MTYEPMMCQWFALCDRFATREVSHPVLGSVPTCERCAERAERQSRTVNAAAQGV